MENNWVPLQKSRNKLHLKQGHSDFFFFFKTLLGQPEVLCAWIRTALYKQLLVYFACTKVLASVPVLKLKNDYWVSAAYFYFFPLLFLPTKTYGLHFSFLFSMKGLRFCSLRLAHSSTAIQHFFLLVNEEGACNILFDQMFSSGRSAGWSAWKCL